MAFQQLQLTAAQRLAQSKLNPALTIQRQTWEKEGFKLAENQAAIPQGAEQRTFTVPGQFSIMAQSAGRAGAQNPIIAPQNFLFYKGGEEAKPAAAAAPAPAAAAPAAVAPPVPQVQAMVPGLSFDVRSTGEDIGIKRADSTSRKNKTINKGTSKLTIPRSSGASSLTIA
jgi:hypothetical protein